MKKFDNFKDAMLYAKHLVDEANKTYIGTVTEQVYKDSNEFTYRESGDMYKSGELFSQFNKGIIIERTPYARRRYYEGGKPGAGNRQAQPRWFDKTITKYRDDYISMYKNSLDEAKR